MKFIKTLFKGDKKMTEEEYKMAVWEHEQIGYKLYSIEVAIENIKEEYNGTVGA